MSSLNFRWDSCWFIESRVASKLRISLVGWLYTCGLHTMVRLCILVAFNLHVLFISKSILRKRYHFHFEDDILFCYSLCINIKQISVRLTSQKWSIESHKLKNRKKKTNNFIIKIHSKNRNHVIEVTFYSFIL